MSAPEESAAKKPRLQSRSGEMSPTEPLWFIVLGATGDLCKKKLFPALAALRQMGLIPDQSQFLFFARSTYSIEELIAKQGVNVQGSEAEKTAFYANCHYVQGSGYDDLRVVDKYISNHCPSEQPDNRVFFLSIPPTAFGGAATAIHRDACSHRGFTHLMIEKPFGKDSASFAELNNVTAQLFAESQLFRIDHYLGKEVILNLMTLRFANTMFEPMWNNKYIESVQINWKEDIGTEGRGGYFDGFGIIRDVIQNHLLQVLIFVAMEEPASLGSVDLNAEKCRLLRAIKPPKLRDLFLGQYAASTTRKHGKHVENPGYLDDETIANRKSLTPTFASVCLKIENERWSGVPFLITAGKALDEKFCEVRIVFKPKPNPLIAEGNKNEFVMRIQPNESIYMKASVKEPGLQSSSLQVPFAMTYSDAFQGNRARDAYERMFLNAARGDNSLFVGSEELVEAWRIFTPALRYIDQSKPEPELYPFGASSPAGYCEFAQKYKVKVTETWEEFLSVHAEDVDKLKTIFESLAQCPADCSDCFITKDGLKQLARQYYDGQEPPEERINKILDVLDVSTDGRISWSEFQGGAMHLHQTFLRVDNNCTDPILSRSCSNHNIV